MTLSVIGTVQRKFLKSNLLRKPVMGDMAGSAVYMKTFPRGLILRFEPYDHPRR